MSNGFQVRYLRESDARDRQFRTYVAPDANTMDLTEDQAEAAAKRIARRDGFALVYFGNTVVRRYGLDPR